MKTSMDSLVKFHKFVHDFLQAFISIILNHLHCKKRHFECSRYIYVQLVGMSGQSYNLLLFILRGERLNGG